MASKRVLKSTSALFSPETELGDKSLNTTKQIKYNINSVLVNTNRAHNGGKVDVEKNLFVRKNTLKHERRFCPAESCKLHTLLFYGSSCCPAQLTTLWGKTWTPIKTQLDAAMKC